MKSRTYTIFLAILVVAVAIPTLYFLSSFSDALLSLFRIILDIRMILIFLLGSVVGFVARPFIEFLTKPSNDEFSSTNTTMRQTIKRKMPKK